MSSTPKAKHSKIGASSYYRWKACPGSVKLSDGIQSMESEYAKEGTLAHELAAEILECFYFKPGERATFPVNMPIDMAEAIKVYTEFVKKEFTKAEAIASEGHILIEHKFDLSSVYEGLYGTADCVLYWPKAKKLQVMDYKHGKGIAVEVEKNSQLMYYGLGALLSTGFPCEVVELVIIQPRCEHPEGVVRKWSFQSIDLLDFAADLAADAEATTKEDAPVVPGEHCRFCPAAATNCPALYRKALEMAKTEFSPRVSYDPARLSLALDALPAIESWVKAVREFAYMEAVNGRPPPGWKLVNKRPSRKWCRTEEEVLSVMKEITMKDVDTFYEKSLKSPSKMEKVVSKQLWHEFVLPMVELVSNGYNLVPVDDPRAAAVLDAKSQFAMIEGD